MLWFFLKAVWLKVRWNFSFSQTLHWLSINNLSHIIFKCMLVRFGFLRFLEPHEEFFSLFHSFLQCWLLRRVYRCIGAFQLICSNFSIIISIWIIIRYLFDHWSSFKLRWQLKRLRELLRMNDIAQFNLT